MQEPRQKKNHKPTVHTYAVQTTLADGRMLRNDQVVKINDYITLLTLLLYRHYAE